MAKQTLVEVDSETAKAFFDAGGTIHLVRVGYGMHAGHTATKEGFRSLEHALAYAGAQLEGKHVPAIDPIDPHPANPLKKS
jgi:hypothetical protein